VAIVQEHYAPKIGKVQSGPAENMLIAGLASLLAVYFARKNKLSKNN
jgi:hypothetical protein